MRVGVGGVITRGVDQALSTVIHSSESLDESGQRTQLSASALSGLTRKACSYLVRARVRAGVGVRARARGRARVREGVLVRVGRVLEVAISPYISLHLPTSPSHVSGGSSR